MEAVVEGLLYVQGDLGLKLEDIMDMIFHLAIPIMSLIENIRTASFY